MTNSGTLFW